MDTRKSEIKTRAGKRKSLQTLQPSANNKLLVGASGPHIFKHSSSKGKHFDDGKDLTMPKKDVSSVSLIHENGSNHNNVTNVSTKVVHSVTCEPDELSAEYWSTIAERRRLALVETVNENDKLREEISQLKAQLKAKTEEVALLTPLANEAQHLAAILKELTDGIEDDSS